MAKVSVILVASGALTTIERTLESLILQKDVDLDLIYIDNSQAPEMNDRLEEQLQSLEARRLSLPGVGRAEVWNQAMAMVEGDYLTFLDAGHLLAEESLKALMAPLDQDINLGGSFGQAAIIDGEANVRSHPENGRTGRIFNRLIDKKHYFAAYPCVMFRKSVMEVGFNEVYRTPKAVFLEFALTLTNFHPFFFVDETIVTAPSEKEDCLILEELVKVFVTVLYSFEDLSERSEQKVRKRLARQLVALGKYHYRREDYDKAGRFISQAVQIAPTYFKGRRYQFLNFVKDLMSRSEQAS
ncbi:MAG: glycosyltransferase family 2 protein [Planctomycetota bacterium]|nr:glycosyltransferase family 2 protein [Planctomycetota bacterium]